MKHLKILLAALILTVTLNGCNEDDDFGPGNNDNSNFFENFGAEVNRDFIGYVVDMNNDPLQNVTVKIGTSTTQTDVNGVFIINGANVYEQFAYITATKAGFINGSRSLVPTSGKNNVRIMMIPSAPIQTISSGSPSEVIMPSGTKVAFDGSFEDESGAAYSGDVSVSMFHLLPSDSNLGSLMPGMLYAEDGIGSEVALSTFGMMNVELRGSGGQKLQIADGHTAEITMDIDSSQASTAPASIPLWYFDELKGYWKQEGVATKNGDKYVGTVSHFSWWNCDAFSATVVLTVTLVDADGNLLSNVGVGLQAGSFNSTIQYTSTTGQVSGLVPANQVMTMNIYDTCGNVISTSTIGPFSSDISLPNIIVTPAQAQSTLIEGTLVQCDNTTPVSNGYVIFQSGTQTSIATVTNGSFSFETLVCEGDETFALEGFDISNLQTTGVIEYTMSAPTTSIGNLVACSAIAEFITYQLDSDPVVYILNNINQTMSGGPGGYMFFGFSSTQQGIYITGNATTPGIYTSAEFQIEASQIGYISQTSPNTVVFNLSNYGAIGEYIDLTFNGTFTDFNGNTRTISGVAHVIRDL